MMLLKASDGDSLFVPDESLFDILILIFILSAILFTIGLLVPAYMRRRKSKQRRRSRRRRHIDQP